jgi:hypothetical protein
MLGTSGERLEDHEGMRQYQGVNPSLTRIMRALEMFDEDPPPIAFLRDRRPVDERPDVSVAARNARSLVRSRSQGSTLKNLHFRSPDPARFHPARD